MYENIYIAIYRYTKQKQLIKKKRERERERERERNNEREREREKICNIIEFGTLAVGRQAGGSARFGGKRDLEFEVDIDRFATGSVLKITAMFRHASQQALNCRRSLPTDIRNVI